MKSFTQTLKIIILALIIGLGVNYLYAWTGPPGPPPTSNAAPPINVSSNPQTKIGAAIFGGLRSLTNLYVDGNVGIGTLSPGAKLDVRGDVNIGTTTNDDLTVSGTTTLSGDVTMQNNAIIFGRVGIGTSSPGVKLEVVGNRISLKEAGRELRFDASNPDPEIGSSTGEIIFWHTDSPWNNLKAGSFQGTSLTGSGLRPLCADSAGRIVECVVPVPTPTQISYSPINCTANNGTIIAVGGGAACVYSYTIPSNAKTIRMRTYGGGGGGGRGGDGGTNDGGGGASGGGGGGWASVNIDLTATNAAVKPNETVTIEVGAGGWGGTIALRTGLPGIRSLVRKGGTELLRANGGGGGFGGDSVSGSGKNCGLAQNSGGGGGGGSVSATGGVTASNTLTGKGIGDGHTESRCTRVLNDPWGCIVYSTDDLHAGGVGVKIVRSNGNDDDCWGGKGGDGGEGANGSTGGVGGAKANNGSNPGASGTGTGSGGGGGGGGNKGNGFNGGGGLGGYGARGYVILDVTF